MEMTSPAPTGPAAARAKAKARRPFRLFTIRFKFALFTGLVIAALMAGVGYFLVQQQRQALTREVLGRGATIAQNLASAAHDPMLTNDDLLTLAFLAAKAVQVQAAAVGDATGHDLMDPQDLVNGLQTALSELPGDLVGAVEQGLSLATGQKVDLGLGMRRPAGSAMENEGIFEAVIVDAAGNVASDYRGTEGHVGLPYQAPHYVMLASPELPYPVYEQEFQLGGRRLTRRLFDLQQPVTETGLDGQVKQLGVVHLGVDQDLVDRVIFSVTMKLAAIALAAVAFGLVLAFLTVTWMTRPIGRLVKGVLAIAGGDFDTRLKVPGRDELGELTSSFNEMALSLGQNEMLKGAFTRYVSDAALKQILADPGKTGLHSRRTLATIYTSDVRGFTAMSETLEPEQVVQVINTYLSLQTEIILQHGGVVDKFIGDATIGVWGKETPAEDDAFNAVRAAWESQAAIDRMNKEREARGEVVKLIGIGVNTGEVVSGNMGSSRKMEYTVTGEHVIFADQICAECPGGKVWISQSTYERIKDKVIVEPAQLSKGHENRVFQVNGFL
jgi:class 3 adenylate cyclase